MFSGAGVVVKLWLAFVTLVLVAIVPPGLALNRMLVSFYQQQVTDPLVYHTERLAEMVAMGPEALLMAPMMGQMAGAEVYAVDAAGQPHRFPGAATAAPGREVLQRALAGESVLVTETGPGGELRLVAAAPVRGPGGAAGAVVLTAPAAPLIQALATARRVLVLAVAGTALLAAGLALVLSRTLVQPLIRMEHATRAMARGDFATRVAVPGEDEIGRLGQAVNALAAGLERYEQSRREFLANVAHELRTPLSYVQGYSQAVAEGVVTSAADRERYLQIIHEEAARLAGLVEDLMDLSAMDEGGALSLTTAPLDLALPVEQAAAMLGPRAAQRAVTLAVELPPGLPPVQADGARVQQVMVNLLDNALRHTPAGGAVRVTAAAEPEPRRGTGAAGGGAQSGRQRPGGWVRVSVSDTGPGIPAADLPLIFERFHKVDRSRAGGGRGLGLAIVRSIVRAHGGEVGVHSAPDAGSTFWFALPVADS